MTFNLTTVSRRVRTQWRPLTVSLRPSQTTAPSGQWLPAFDDALVEWGQWCEQNPGACVSVDLSAHWLLVAVADDPAESWQHYYGLNGDELAQNWLIRSVDVGLSQLHCAMPRSLIDGIQDVARQHAVKVLWAGPWWVRDLQDHVAAQIGQGERIQPWSVQEPGLSVHASLTWDAEVKPHVHLRQVWCEAEAA